jgi:hypothetical protein
MQLSKEYLERFLNKNIGVTWNEGDKDFYIETKLLEVFGDCIAVYSKEKGITVLLSIDRIKKLRILDSGGGLNE